MSDLTCRSCGEGKAIELFPLRVRDGRRKYARCLSCEAEAQKLARVANSDRICEARRAAYHRHKTKQKDTALRRKYGIGLDARDALFASQGMRCAICFATKPGGRGWQTDHSHETGSVRAILCHHCNSLLGHAKESPEVLLAAFRYLCKHGGGAEAFLRSHFSKTNETQQHELNTTV